MAGFQVTTEVATQERNAIPTVRTSDASGQDVSRFRPQLQVRHALVLPLSPRTVPSSSLRLPDAPAWPPLGAIPGNPGLFRKPSASLGPRPAETRQIAAVPKTHVLRTGWFFWREWGDYYGSSPFFECRQN